MPGDVPDVELNSRGVAVGLLYFAAKCLAKSRDFVFSFGSGAGIRTLNLAVNRSLHPVQKWRLELAECCGVSSNSTVCHGRCCTERPRLSCARPLICWAWTEHFA